MTQKRLILSTVAAAALIIILGAWMTPADDPIVGKAGRFSAVPVRIEAFVGDGKDGKSTQLHEYPTSLLVDSATGRTWFLRLSATTNGLAADWLPVTGGPQ